MLKKCGSDADFPDFFLSQRKRTAAVDLVVQIELLIQFFIQRLTAFFLEVSSRNLTGVYFAAHLLPMRLI